jgi:hypothetical protein
MAQRRSGRDEDDLSDVKALAAKARETGGPVLRQNPADLSGVRPRRDSVVGMRLTPPPRATGGGELPNWLWGVLGCLTVLLVGFAGLFFLGRTGKLAPLLGEAASLLGAPPAAPAAPPEPAPAAAPAAPAEPAAAAKDTEAPAPAAPAPSEHAARAEHTHPGHEAPAAAAPAPTAEAPAAPAEPAAAAAAQPPADDATASKHPHGAAPKAKAKEGETPTPGGDDDGTVAEAAPAAAKAARPAAAPKAAAADDSDDDSSLPGQDDVEKALDALAPRMRGCFVKYQIKGTARVRLVATPAGRAESINVTGDFEDTPTGNCVESILSEAKLPTFKGPPLKLSQSYQLR